MAYKKLHYLPVSVFLSIPFTFLLTYTVAVLLGHVDPGFPYISDTGTLSPESCLFSQFLNISAALMGICVYIRYRQVSEHLKALPLPRPISRRCNRVVGWVGAAACLGLDVVANFQETNVRVVHFTGATTCFVGGTIYFCMQTWFSYMMKSELVGTFTLWVRACLAFLCIVGVFTTSIAASMAGKKFSGDDKLKWSHQDDGWEMHLMSTASEWAMSIMFCAFILSYVNEFYYTTMTPPAVRVRYPSQKSSPVPEENHELNTVSDADNAHPIVRSVVTRPPP